jgi:putative transposase
MFNKNLYQEKYLIRSTRRPNYDYSSPGSYFITICTKYRKPHFGRILNQKINLTEIGEMARSFWIEIPQHFKNVLLDEFIIMPDHLHGIIIILNKTSNPRDIAQLRLHRIQPSINQQMSQISPKPNSLPTIIRSYKSICTREINKIYPSAEFKWQSRFHERIIQNNYQLKNVQNYIRNNPKNCGNK